MSIARNFLLLSGLLFGINAFGAGQSATPFVVVNTNAEPVASGKFEPSWESLKQYQCPQWFRDAKFGIWAHWGPQCEPEDGDWYARGMYQTGGGQYRFHTNHYGSPSVFGFKDVIHEWKAENWDPEKLVALYKRAGAQYFIALANHHDNFDLWDSKYQPWNSVAVGPKKDLIGGWAAAARKYGLRFGVSVHAAHAWSWYEPAQDYDGRLTASDGKGKWWDGLDPQDLYAQNHQPSSNYRNPGSIHSRWNWGNGVRIPEQAYCDKFYNRTIDLINKYHPDLIYFDDTALPLWPISDAGLKIAAHFYNANNQWHGTNDDGVLFGKILTPEQQKCMVWDIERGQANEIEPYPWQTDTCIGGWHYDRGLFNRNGYKNAKTVIQMLVDIVSKNGNLLLNIPVRGDGTIDEKELQVVEGVAGWMDVNKECIFGTHPWKVFGEGPASAGAKLMAQGFNEGKGKPLTSEDVRFTQKDSTLYAIVLGAPTNGVSIKALGRASKLLDRNIQRVELLGSGERLQWEQGQDALTISQPNPVPNKFAVVFKLVLSSLAGSSLALAADSSAPVAAQTDVAALPPDNDKLNFGQALIPDMVADPSIVDVDGTFYCYATTDGWGQGLNTSGTPVVWTSKDFLNWSFEGSSVPSDFDLKYWAPSTAVHRNGRYYSFPTLDGKITAVVADSPLGPFVAPDGQHVTKATLQPFPIEQRSTIDAEVFADDDGQAYMVWSRRREAKLKPDLLSPDGATITIPTKRDGYSEGPFLTKRNGIYYYFYTLGGDEGYQYAYMMSHTSPLGPWEAPEIDIIATTDRAERVFGPGHGCFMHPQGRDQWYFVYLEYGRGGTTRQIYADKMNFNPNGTIQPIKLTKTGVGALRPVANPSPNLALNCRATASSIHPNYRVRPRKDPSLDRVETYAPANAVDNFNGTRWLADPGDRNAWFQVDLGAPRDLRRTEAYFVKPAAGHAYRLEWSLDGVKWQRYGGHEEVIRRSPHRDEKSVSARYLKLTILAGEPGLWEFRVY